MIHHFGGVFFINMLRYVKNMLNFLLIILLILTLIASYQLGKQANIINNQKKRNANDHINDINTIIDKLHKGKF